jgi:hypothetical protein
MIIIELCSFLLISIFFCLAALHFYWAVGGRWAAADAAPVNEQGKPVMNTGPFSCIIVGGGLILFALYYLIFILNVKTTPDGLVATPGWIIPIIFILRTIGDFRYVGLTKKFKHSAFARNDAKYYTPICILIAVLAIAVQLFS